MSDAQHVGGSPTTVVRLATPVHPHHRLARTYDRQPLRPESYGRLRGRGARGPVGLRQVALAGDPEEIGLGVFLTLRNRRG